MDHCSVATFHPRICIWQPRDKHVSFRLLGAWLLAVVSNARHVHFSGSLDLSPNLTSLPIPYPTIGTRVVSNWNRFLPLTAPECLIAAPKRECYVINYTFAFFHFRCPKDETVRFHSGPSTTQQFSFEAFQFLNAQVEPYLYVHCEVVLCNLTDAEPSCRKDCSDPLVDSRQKRAVNTDI